MRAQPADARMNEAQMERARAQFAWWAFEDAWDEGQSIALEAAVGLALR